MSATSVSNSLCKRAALKKEHPLQSLFPGLLLSLVRWQVETRCFGCCFNFLLCSPAQVGTEVSVWETALFWPQVSPSSFDLSDPHLEFQGVDCQLSPDHFCCFGCFLILHHWHQDRREVVLGPCLKMPLKQFAICLASSIWTGTIPTQQTLCLQTYPAWLLGKYMLVS